MNESGTTYRGPLGSTIHVLRADAGTVAELAAIDWNRHFRRVCLDPVRGLITLMSPSRLHEDLTTILDHIVDIAGSIITGGSKGLLSTRLRGRGEPPGTGMEPDCAFYVGERARGYLKTLRQGEAAADAYLERTAPDLVVEAEITSADEGKAERYGELGVRELWRLHGRKGTRELRVDFLALGSGSAPRELDASEVLVWNKTVPRPSTALTGAPAIPRSGIAKRPHQRSPLEGLTPDDVCEAVEGVRFGLNDDERREAVTRIVRRRQRASVRVREDGATYRPSRTAESG